MLVSYCFTTNGHNLSGFKQHIYLIVSMVGSLMLLSLVLCLGWGGHR